MTNTQCPILRLASLREAAPTAPLSTSRSVQAAQGKSLNASRSVQVPNAQITND
ncbi:MAG: hypothetical protein RMX97_16190 [Nostoc sp. DedQUE11]|nr:hypothetical protein [Nostoc sp. DedQUE11]